MQKGLKKICLTVLTAAALTAPVAILAQDGQEKGKKEKKEGEQITIFRTGDTNEKLVVEVVGDKITVNGKEVKEGDNDGLRISRHKIKDVYTYGGANVYAPSRNVFMSTLDENRAMLGVTTDKDEKGALIKSVSKESAAEKAGLKEGDIITRIGDKKIAEPDDLSKAVREQKPGDKVIVTYLRDKKEQKVTAELTKWKGVSIFNAEGQNFNFNMPEFDFDLAVPNPPRTPRAPRVSMRGFDWEPSPKLGLTVQDSEDGKGVNVLEVDEDGNAAKAGIKEDDVITEVDGKAVNSADEVSRIMKESKTKTSVKFKYQRKGKTETVDVKIPKKLKTADL